MKLSVSQYQPPRGLASPHLQTILSSVGPRRLRVNSQFAPHRAKQQTLLLDCQDGVRLSGVLNLAGEQSASELVILIHGWEGSASSSYMLSLTTTLLNNGFDVFRLNLRDHGDTHHLNKGIFNSTLVPEVIAGLEDLQARLSYQRYNLVGYSLGGNFALRVAALAKAESLSLSKVIAFCPVLHAGSSNEVLNAKHNFVYGKYFVRKWKRSLYKKIACFPDYDFADQLAKLNTLDEMNQEFIPRYTEFKQLDDYFQAYAITGDMLADTLCPCYLHFAKDDMIIPYQDIDQLAPNPDLHISLSEYGGHCGFIQNWLFDSWQDQRALELLKQA